MSVRWQEREVAVARDRSLSNEDVAAILGRSAEGVRRYRQRYLGFVSGRAAAHHWTPSEDAMVLDKTKTMREIAASLGVEWSQVRSRRQRLMRGTQSKMPARRISTPQGHPTWLIAKTCRRCGALRMRGDFVRQGRVQSACNDCGTRQSLEALKVRQSESLEGASNRGKEWTKADLQVAFRADLPVAERARLLGRTQYAINAVIGAYGGRDRAK